MAKFTKEETDQIIRVCDIVWAAIGSDVGAEDNDVAIECILDADRPKMYCKPLPEVWTRFESSGYAYMVKFIKKRRVYA